MSKKTNEIADNEIRVISAYEPKVQKEKKRFTRVYIPIIAFVLLLAIVAWIVLPTEPEKGDVDQLSQVHDEQIIDPQIIATKNLTEAKEHGSVVVIDTVINKNGLLILCPENLRPRLVLGSDNLNASSVVLATQAADVRGDNGQIAGTFVMNGELISKGEAKAGFCSIINNEITIGVSDATPMLEQSLTEDGYFFRQYPLVVGGQIVENKPKGKAIRKALAELDGKMCVVMSKERLTFHDFSQLLIDVGVRNAIYLVGSTSYGFYINGNGEKILTGITPEEGSDNVSYIVWE